MNADGKDYPGLFYHSCVAWPSLLHFRPQFLNSKVRRLNQMSSAVSPSLGGCLSRHSPAHAAVWLTHWLQQFWGGALIWSTS